ncbi:MAG: hypothetical protein EXR76_06790 [Myxococcales bacterium]|nr:hypothetical protein [Myxococcales bacterium]
MHLTLPSLTLALSLSACILTPEDCARGFTLEEGRCVASEDPGPFPRPERDASSLDFEPFEDLTPPRRDAEKPLLQPDAAPSKSPWGEARTLLIVDRTADDQVRLSSATPGYDLDAVVITQRASQSYAVKVLEALVLDPHGQSVATDMNAALNEPEFSGQEEDFVSLGGGGAYLLLLLDDEVKLDVGTTIDVVDYSEQARVADRFALWACPGFEADLRTCWVIGDGVGSTQLVLR